jgi:hypothetical protein
MKVIIEEAITPAVFKEFGDTATLRLEVLDGFTSSDGVLVPPTGQGKIYLDATITIDNDEMHFPAIEIDSTEDAAPWDSPNTGDVRGYRISIITQRGKRIPYFSECKVPILTGGDTSFTWEELRVFNRVFRPRKGHYSQFDRLINVDQVQSWIQAALGARGFASINSAGITALSSPPIDPSFPIALSPTDPEYQALLSGGGESVVDVASQATAGDGTEADPWTGWDTAIAWAARTEYRFRTGWFAYASSPNFLKEDIAIIGEAGTYLKHTGTGDAFKMESPSPGSIWVHRVRVENLTIIGSFSQLIGTATAAVGTNQVVGVGTSFLTQIAIGQAISFNAESASTESRIVTAIADDTNLTVSGNWTGNLAGNVFVGKSRHGLYLNGVRDSLFSHISVRDVADCGLYSARCVTNSFLNFVVSPSEPTQGAWFTIRSQHGLVLDTDTTTWTFIGPIVEATQTVGIWTKNGSYGNTFINGTSEAHKGKGAIFASQLNTIINTDFEANDGNDIEILSSSNKFINILSQGAIVINAGQRNSIDGGTINDLTIDAAVDFSTVRNVLINGTFTDNASTTYKYANMETLGVGFRYDTKLGNVLPRAVVLATDPVVATNAQLGSYFFLAVLQNTTLSNPTNGVNGQTLTYALETSGGPFTLTFGDKFIAPAGRQLPPVARGRLKFTATYSAAMDAWIVGDASPKSGQDTFAGAATKVVIFAVNEPDTNYKVNIAGNVNETFWITDKQTTGFTLNSSNPASVAVVDWSIIR